MFVVMVDNVVIFVDVVCKKFILEIVGMVVDLIGKVWFVVFLFIVVE